ncbi:MAG TPA: phosphoenolpyruvate--protein phosphotransferase [Sphingomicrobium sp.]|nr:phosphoenolpyruvate--protein phosphotransferase [Sphingomicrobium sp.]
MNEIILLAPCGGWLTPLDEVPDPVFAERMMGEGLAIDPLEAVVRAPADAMVIAIPDTAHAVTLKLANGAELLIHIGLETVALKGAGFRALSSAGTWVKAGDPLIEVDLAQVARGALSLVTPIVVANEGFTLSLEPLSRPAHSGDRIGTIRGQALTVAGDGDGEGYERTIQINAPHGLHARPAARIAALLKQFRADVIVTHADRTANARSTVALMGLGLRKGDTVRVAGRGEHGQAAVDAMLALIEAGFGEENDAVPRPAHLKRAGPVCASPGIAVGTIVQLRAADLPVPLEGAGIAEERAKLTQALEAVASSLAGDGIAAELAAAHRELLEDPDLIDRANREIAEARSAAFAWRSACEAAREALRATGDDLLIERAADLLDLERRVIAEILGGEASPARPLPADAIVVASDLLPSEFLALDRERLAGICTAEGGPTSHVAILAASAGIPMVVAAGPAVLEIQEGNTAILDADRCSLEAKPDDARLAGTRAEISERRERQAAEVRDAQAPCFTADGFRIEVFANLASVEDAKAAVEAGAEGCGLLRTEFLALGRDGPPDEEEQRRVYAEIAAGLGGRPLIIRTFDIGADKKVPWLGTSDEENPALGLRGVRLSLARPDLFATQLRAILRGVPASQRRIMLPMIADLSELRDARAALERAEAEVGSLERTPLGIMVETPASALLADELAAEADFLSVGTNDLTQYVLAADRTNAGVSAMLDSFHPAVLRLMSHAAKGAATHDRWLGVCGGIASDPLAAGILIGLGVTELSAAPAAVPSVKAAVRRLRQDACRALAERACAATSAREVRAIATEALQ